MNYFRAIFLGVPFINLSCTKEPLVNRIDEKVLGEAIDRVWNFFPEKFENIDKNELLKKCLDNDFFRALQPFCPDENSNLWWDELFCVLFERIKNQMTNEEFVKIKFSLEDSLDSRKKSSKDDLSCLEQCRGGLVLNYFSWKDCIKFENIKEVFSNAEGRFILDNVWEGKIVFNFKDFEILGCFAVSFCNKKFVCSVEKDFLNGVSEEQKHIFADFFIKICKNFFSNDSFCFSCEETNDGLIKFFTDILKQVKNDVPQLNSYELEHKDGVITLAKKA